LSIGTPKQLKAMMKILKKEDQLYGLEVIVLSSVLLTALVWMLFAS